MKKVFKITLLIVTLTLIATSCNTKSKPQVVIDENTVAEDFVIQEDTTMVKVLSLPVYIDSTQYIYHPTKLLSNRTKNDSRRFSISKNSYQSGNSNSKYSHYRFNGQYAGFAVENIKTGEIIKITDQEINFSNVKIYNKLEYNPRVEFVLYEGHDLDTNKDERLNHRDVSALFISNLDGSKFKKLSVDFEEYLSYSFLVANDKLYFQTVKDLNGDGKYENDDEYLNYVVDLIKEDKQAIRYDTEPAFKQNQ
ncbi:hypothetical protein JCM19314_1476 [Nonlabens ulvanivorans]|uniref:Lipoprotein n=1 Tax=Nonlabens ulvanivorans TaxID=906888 RepID=A0A090QFN5_NONUL|nr:hypothetical protein [Nonlabens ulvanivorans]GAL01756.1 hypothetical protein JCM19314_1476 [Nonlabens ulvanivorans]